MTWRYKNKENLIYYEKEFKVKMGYWADREFPKGRQSHITAFDIRQILKRDFVFASKVQVKKC